MASLDAGLLKVYAWAKYRRYVPAVESNDAFLQNTPALVFIATTNGALIRWSAALEELLGRPLTEAMTVADLLLEDDRDAVNAAWGRLREGGDAVSFECRVRVLGRSVRDCVCSARVPRDPRGRSEVHGALQVLSGPQERERRLLQGITENLEIVVWSINRQGVFTWQKGKGLEKSGLKQGQFVGMNVFELYASDAAGLAGVRRGLAGENIHYYLASDGVEWEHWLIPSPDGDEETALMGVSLDVTERTRAERELAARLDLIQKQQQTIHALSTPIIQVWDSVLTAPLLGVIDSARAAELMQDLLNEVVRTRSRYAILDLTGVESMDTGTAGHLIQMIRAIQLLGAEGIITGIHPNIAQTMVGLGLDMSHVVTLGNLRAGLKLCMQRMRERRELSG